MIVVEGYNESISLLFDLTKTRDDAVLTFSVLVDEAAGNFLATQRRREKE